ncbi:hypothetical protein PR202_gb12023 [Eleusine coracana subsp. coracana]|uniref:Uncharacterized protein n=1 Tax=Eleusine coracana subsp. coracana TaxID=191504 RepID=A0AAV5ENM8_ELECO|nr:hypothetical protein PR202_gb12023 [Eleusine coracana subsp. coracana]
MSSSIVYICTSVTISHTMTLSALVGKAFYFAFLSFSRILYNDNLDTREMSEEIHEPPSSSYRSVALLTTEDGGGLKLAAVKTFKLCRIVTLSQTKERL